MKKNGVEKTLEKVSEWIEEYQELLDMQDFEIDVKIDDREQNTFAYTTELVYYDKKFLIVLTPLFFEQDEDFQKNIILHEFIHTLMKFNEFFIEKLCEEIKYYYEEMFVNKLTRAYMKLLLKGGDKNG